jgi:hypothetical protein
MPQGIPNTPPKSKNNHFLIVLLVIAAAVFGLLVLANMPQPENMTTCPDCKAAISRNAISCPKCGWVSR